MTSTEKEPVRTMVGRDQLTLWRGTDGRYEVVYVGYPLSLSPTEGQIVETLLSAAAQGKDDYTPVEILQKAGHLTGQAASAAQVSVLVNRINRKAREIGGRPLIECRRRCGFRICATL